MRPGATNEDVELIALLADRPTRDARVTTYVGKGCGCQNPMTDPKGLARKFGIS